MKTATTALVNFINGTRQALQFDLWTINLASGTLLRWTDADVDVKLPADGRVFVRGPVITRDRVTWVRGIQVDQLRVTLAGPTVSVDGKQLPSFAAAGGLDGAKVTLERVYMNDAGVVQGSMVWFPGVVADVTPSRMGAEVVIKSQLTQLSQQLPRNLYQAGCLNNLYDVNCTANRASFTVTGTVTAVGTGSNPALTVSLSASVAARYLELGALKFTSGPNNGFGRQVQSQPGSGLSVVLNFARPFPFTVAVGDAFTAYAGCDKTPTTCNTKFNKLARFRGLPYVPAPETVT